MVLNTRVEGGAAPGQRVKTSCCEYSGWAWHHSSCLNSLRAHGPSNTTSSIMSIRRPSLSLTDKDLYAFLWLGPNSVAHFWLCICPLVKYSFLCCAKAFKFNQVPLSYFCFYLQIILVSEYKGRTEDEMAGWHHWLSGHGFGWTLGVGDGQGGLACCGPWGGKGSDTTERLNVYEEYHAEYYASL